MYEVDRAKRILLDSPGLRGGHQKVSWQPDATAPLAALYLHCEAGFRKVKGIQEIAAVLKNIGADKGSGQRVQIAA